MKIAVNGTFDIVHPGHLALLNHAASLGDYLLVAIDSDRRIRENKGINRPINNEHDRKILLENLKAVDEVQIFDSDEELEEIYASYGTDILLIGKEYEDKRVVAREQCGEVQFYERINPYSSTAIIQRITDR
jgi:rfaE bifunctional protein nucleotidyltransferase chain/domain